MGGGQSPGHYMRNAMHYQPDPLNSYRDANSRIVYNAPAKSPRPAADPYLSLMNRAISALAPQRPNAGIQNQLLSLLGGGQPQRAHSGRVPRANGMTPGGSAAGAFGGYGGYGRYGGTTHSQIPGYIGAHQQQKTPGIQQFLPHWATSQAMHDIRAKGAVRGAPQSHMQELAGSRGLDYGSPMYAASAVRNHMEQAGQAARAAADVDFQDHLERAKFDIRHALARNQDVLQGGQNQALRDAMAQQGGSQYFNQILGLIGGLS
jgi:hypothetical protein